jgi:tetratricopeptide (TPR) repeat protein
MAKELRPSKVARYLLLLPALLVVLAYLPTLQSQFVWDDVIFLGGTPLYRDPTLWREALRNPLVFSSNYFRPLAVLTIMGELRLWGLNPAGFHLTSLLLHALNSTLVALLARELLRPAAAEERKKAPAPGLPSSSLALAVAVGVVYGLHPALAEAVAFASSRADLLVTTFLLLALLAHARWMGRKFLRPLGVGLAFLAAALTKEMAIALPPALVLWSLALARPQVLRTRREVDSDGNPAWRNLLRQTFVRDLRVYVAVLAAGVIYLVARYSLLGYLYQPRTGHGVPTGDALQHVLLVARSLAEYVLLVVWPFTTLTPVHYSLLPVPLDALAGWLALAASLGILIGLGWLLRKTPKLGALPVAGVLGLAPVVNLIPLQLAGGTFIAERFLTFPLALMALGAGALLARSRERIARAVLLLWLVPCVITVERTLPHWRDDLSLWNWAAQRAPRSSMPHSNLAQVYLDRKNYSKTLEEAGLALERDPLDAHAWNERGVALYFSHRYPEAQAAFAKATELQPTDALFWSNLAGVLRDEGKFPEAERILLDKALRLDVTLGAAYLNLGILYLRADRPDMAAAPLKRAAELLPPGRQADARNYLNQTRQPEPWLHLGYLRLKDRDFRGALEAFDQAEQLGAEPAQVAVGKGAAFVEMKQWAEAKSVLEAALRKTPNDAYLNNNLGVVAQMQGDLQAARRYYARAAALDPNWAVPRQNLARLGGPR